jgi:4-hydroxybenzoate polyprenyltransferase
MKRITWWPQAWLGLVFSWGGLVGWIAVTGSAGWPMALLYAGSICWVIGYDTIYALQDREDDALVGVRSTARRFGAQVRLGVMVFYALALFFWAAAFWTLRPQPMVWLPLIPIAWHLGWQVAMLSPDDGEDALAKFRSNRMAGLLMALACLIVGATS